MRKTTLLVTITALAFAGACGKKKEENKKTPPPPTTPTTTTPTPTPTPTPPPPPPPVKLEGADLAKRFIECHAAWDAQDKDKFKGCYAKDATSRFVDSMMPERKGADAIAASALEFHAAFPDGKNAPQLVLVNGRDIASVLLFTGTNSAPMKGGGQEMPPTNKKVAFKLLHMATFDDANQITQEWWIMDDTTMAAQLGWPGVEGGRPFDDKAMEGAPSIVVASGSEVEKANLATLQKGNEAFNAHDLKGMMADFADDAVVSDQGGPTDELGKKAIEPSTKMFTAAFPDGKITTLKSWAAGDYVVGISTFAGTNTGNMGPMKKTGKAVNMTIGELSKFEGGKIKQLWRFYNSHKMAIQLGLAPDPSQAAPGGAAGSAAGSAPGSAAGSATK